MFKFKGVPVNKDDKVLCTEQGYIHGAHRRLADGSCYVEVHISVYRVIQVHEKSMSIFTGLADSKGVEIYSGDIYKSPKGHIGVVEYNIESAGFTVLGHAMLNEKGVMKGEIIGTKFLNPNRLPKEEGIDDKQN